MVASGVCSGSLTAATPIAMEDIASFMASSKPWSSGLSFSAEAGGSSSSSSSSRSPFFASLRRRFSSFLRRRRSRKLSFSSSSSSSSSSSVSPSSSSSSSSSSLSFRHSSERIKRITRKTIPTPTTIKPSLLWRAIAAYPIKGTTTTTLGTDLFKLIFSVSLLLL